MSKHSLPPGTELLGDVYLVLVKDKDGTLGFAIKTHLTGVEPYFRASWCPGPEDALDDAWRDDVRNDCSVWPDLLVEVMWDCSNVQLKAF